MTARSSEARDATRRSESSRRAILAAAFDLVGEVGYTKLSIEGIAARAGVGKQTIYRWWPSKGAVLFDAILMLSSHIQRDGDDRGRDARPASLPDTGDLEADLKAVLHATVDELNDPAYDRPLRALSAEILHDPGLAADYAERLDGPTKQLKKQRLRSAQRVGQLPADLDLDIAVELLWGPLRNRWLERSGSLTYEYADKIVETALDGLRHR